MGNGFDINGGIEKVIKNLVNQDENFPSIIFGVLLGEEDSLNELETTMKSESYNNSLNEVVAVHRLFKGELNETVTESGIFDFKLMKKLRVLRKKNKRIQKKTLIRTLKEPGMLRRLIYIIKALLTPGYPLDDLVAAPQFMMFVGSLVRNGIQVTKEENLKLRTA